MRPIYKALGVTIILLFSNFLMAQEHNSYPFKDGETINFVLNYTWGGVVTDVGSAVCTTTYTTINNEGAYSVILTGRSYKFFDVFFKVRERFESKFYEKNLRPIYFYRNAQEGNYSMKNTLHFNHDYSIKSRTQKRERIPFDTLLIGTKNTFDLISLVFNYRTIDVSKLVVNQKTPLEFVIDKKIYSLYFIYKGKEKKRIPGLGTFNTLKFAASVVEGNVFTGKDNLYLWISDDENKIPLFFEAPIIVGKVQGRASKIEGEKYPLKSKIK